MVGCLQDEKKILDENETLDHTQGLLIIHCGFPKNRESTFGKLIQAFSS